MSDGCYRECTPDPDLALLVQCTWERQVGDLESRREVRVVPDGCMDLLWMQGELLVAGPDTQAWLRRLPAGTTIAGLRFHPGAAPGLLNVPADELLNTRVPVQDCSGSWADEVSWHLCAALVPSAEIMQDAVRALLRRDEGGQDPVVRYVVQAIRTAPYGTYLTVRDLADDAGLSERQLHRRCRHSLGYGVKTFARIVRFQRLMDAARSSPSHSLGQLAADAGYADQAHMSSDVRRLAGQTPGELLAYRA
jgi:AraC-like DNA-binding protein